MEDFESAIKQFKSIVLCPYCGSAARIRKAEAIYGSGPSGCVYVCSNYPVCDAYVGCHPGTQKPLGTLANAKLRLLRRNAHNVFDRWWKSGRMTRTEAYRELSQLMDLDTERTHIAMMDAEECKRLLEIRQAKNKWKTPRGLSFS